MKHVELGPYLEGRSAMSRSTSVLRDAGIRALLLHLRPDEEIPEHKAKGPITVQCLHGSALFRAAAEQCEMTAGTLLSLPAEVPHSLLAREECLVLVTICE